jgi:hypothetical protein
MEKEESFIRKVRTVDKLGVKDFPPQKIGRPVKRYQPFTA